MLLDIKKTPKKPQYTMAPEIPLVLQSCDFEELNFTCSSGNNFTLNSFFEKMVIVLFLNITDAWQTLRLHLEDECRSIELESTMHHEALLTLLPEHGS